jgi:Na+-translocating ferredoxin:NAD+ oxidoreductase RnfG subunit
VDEALAASIKADMQILNATTKTRVELTAYEGLPTAVLSAEITASGNYVLELRAAGYGINGGSKYHPASGEYIRILVSMTADGKIIDCLTVYQAETDGIGSACENEDFYGQFDGKTKENYGEIDAIAGATMTTNGYKNAILHAFEAVEIFEGGDGQ